MWERLSRADIEETKQQLNNRREETLRRHAEELTVLESEQAGGNCKIRSTDQ